MRYKAFVFDLDGTLIDSCADLGNSVNRVLRSQGFPIHNLEAYRIFIGDGAEMMVRRALPDESRNETILKSCLDQFLEDYSVNYNVHTVLYPGIPELLNYLTAKNLKLSILTNKPNDLAQRFVEELMKHWDFDFVLGHKKGNPKKPDPYGAQLISNTLDLDASEFVYLGDSGIDMKTANAVGMLPVGVLWGFRDSEELLSNGAKHLIKYPLEIIDLLDI